MKARFTDEQIIALIKEQESGEKTADVWRWRQRHQFKKMVTPVGKRNAVVHLMEVHQVSQRRACDVLQVDRSSVRYLSRRGDDAELRDAIKRVSRERRRFGCRRVHVMIAREGFAVNHKKVRRIYTEEKLQVRHRGGRKRALGTRKPMVLPDGPNQRWSLGFVSDALTDGRRFRILAVGDDFSRENLVLVADTSLSGQRVARELDKVIAERGMPNDLPPVGPSFITRVCRLNFDSRVRRPGQARRARSPQIAQALGALAVASGSPAMSAV